MSRMTPSIKIYYGLVTALALLAAVNVFLPQGDFVQMEELPASRTVLALTNAIVMLAVYGGLGFVGLKLSRSLGFADIWDLEVSNSERFVYPGLIGVGIGVVFILADYLFAQFHGFGPLPHPPFPTSLVASAVAGIGEEMIFRLFFISFWVWLISHVFLKRKFQGEVFWSVAVISALVFAAGHIPTVMVVFGLHSIAEIPYWLMSEIFLLNGMLSIFCAFYFRKYGFLAAVGIHFWTDVVWHVIWGIV